MSEELERSDCPFCGENELVQSNTWSGYLGRHVETIECKCCGASAPEDKWNTRPPVVAEAEPVARNWTEDFEHENGEYTCLCRECHNEFIGYKRRTICKACAKALSVAPPASGAVPVPRELLCKLVEEGCIGSVTDAEWAELHALLAKGMAS